MVAKLREISLFRDIPEDQLEPLADACRVKEYRAREVIFREYDTAKDVYFVLKGHASIVACEPRVGCRQIMTVGDGDLLAWSAVLGQPRLTATARTIDNSTVLAIDGEKLLNVCKSNTELGFEIMRRTAEVLADRLHGLRVQLLEISGVHLPEVVLESD